MVNGAVEVRAGAGDLRLERHDARIEFANRQRIKILPPKQRDRITGAGRRREIVRVHSKDGRADGWACQRRMRAAEGIG